MRIAYLVNHYPHASHSFIRREILALEKQGLPVQRLSIRREGNTIVDPQDKAEAEKTFVFFDHLLEMIFGILIWFLKHPIRSFSSLRLAARIGYNTGTLKKTLFYCAEGIAIAQWAQKNSITHIHAHFGTNPAAVAMFCRLAGGPSYSFTIHGPEEFDSPQRLALSDKIQHATFVIAISQFGRSQIYRWIDLDQWKKIHVVHCGVDGQFLENSVSPVPDTNLLVCVGRLCEQKGQLILVQAASELARQQIQFQLLFVGDGPMRPEIEAEIAKNNLNSRTAISGWQTNEQVRQHILASRAMVLASFAEGLPVAIMEASALGRPVISTQIAGIPELIEPGISGWLVPPGSVCQLADAMKSALKTPVGELDQMGKAGRERVELQHNGDVEAGKLLGHFKTYLPA
ncbi:MAG TPA: glycosyltransferase [Tepidisphaeraceae bacterium]|nr:glycosyltransferase [Tepidisphaeraceae bacterium]